MDPRRLLPVLAAVAAACVVATILVAVARPDRDPDPPRREAARSSPAAGAGPGPAAVLAQWDGRRAAAWAAGDADRLRRLYATGSRTGAADVRLLRHYLARGLRVEGLTTQVLGLDVVEESPGRLVLDVTDRLVGGSAVGGATPIALPADRASTRRIVLVRSRERWVVAEARDRTGSRARAQARAEASTSRTSSSSKS